MAPDLILALILGIGCLIGAGIVARRLWLAATNPAIAYRLGHKFRRTVENAAQATGQVSGTIDGAADVVARSFREGRDSVKDRDSGPSSGA